MARRMVARLCAVFVALCAVAAPAAASDILLALAGVKATGTTMMALVGERLSGIPFTVIEATPTSMRLRTSEIGYFKLLADARITRVRKVEGAVLPDATASVRHTAYTLRLRTDGVDPLPFRTAVPSIRTAVLLGRRSAPGRIGANAVSLPRYGIEFRAVGADGSVLGSTVIEDPRTLRHEPTTTDGRHLASATFRRTDAIVTVVIAESGTARRIEIRNRRGSAEQSRLIGTVALP